MKKKHLIMFSVLLILIIGVVAVAINIFKSKESNEKKEAQVDVHVEDTAIIYIGPMADEGVELVKQLYNKRINRLVLNSPGGDINIGMDLGEWVFDNGLDVEIKNIAFSSAANYVFTAGKNKFLHKSSMVGWHGGATQKDNGLFMELFMRKYLKESKAREKEYFKKIGVNQLSTVYGQRAEFDKYSEEQNYVGWTYTLDAMAKLGIKNIILIDGEWVPASEYNGKKIFTVSDIKE